MRAIVFAATLAVPFTVCALAAGEEAKHVEPTYRLLVLDGSEVRWALPAGQPVTTVTYAYLTQAANFESTRNCGKMLPPDAALAGSKVERSTFRREVRAAFDMWEAAANIRFLETHEIDEAGILIGSEAEPRGRAFTNVAPHGSAEQGARAIEQSLICINPATRWKVGFDGDLDVYDLRYTMAHEIGHAIGLDHPSAEGQLMSYRYVERERALQPGDIAGAVAIYGASQKSQTPSAVAGLPPGASSRPMRKEGDEGAAPTGGSPFGLGDAERPRQSPAR